jgi:hypothetical protein
MRFSNIAHQYLEGLHRNKKWVFSDSEKLATYLIQQGVPPFEKIIDFQLNFSGFELTITGKGSSTFNVNLFLPSHIESNTEIDFIKIEDKYYFDCGDHRTAQFWFVISDSGEIGTYNNNDETVNIIFSSFDKFIESYAMEDLYHKSNKYEHPYYYTVIDLQLLNNYFTDFQFHEAGNDSYNTWLVNEQIIVHRGTWYDRPASYLHVYGDKKKECELLIDSLTKQKIIE